MMDKVYHVHFFEQLQFNIFIEIWLSLYSIGFIILSVSLIL